VSVQAQVLNTLADLRDRLGLALLFISHDLAVVRYLADRIYVMLDGQVVEEGDADTILADPQHAYTRTLIASIPGGHGVGSGGRERALRAKATGPDPVADPHNDHREEPP
jgi:peptide/nickel transport system ATP-binding protein